MRNLNTRFFLVSPLPIWGCISIWLSTAIRAAPETIIFYLWASLVFSYIIIFLYYVQMISISQKENVPANEKEQWLFFVISTLFFVGSLFLSAM